MEASRVLRQYAGESLVIGFDADDTLWQAEVYYRQAAEKFALLLSPYQDAEGARRTLSEIEVRNVASYGYGFKSYTLSMVEAAVTLAGNGTPSGLIDAVLELGRSMLTQPVLLFEHARETLRQLTDRYRLMLITKGDLLEQSNKVRRSGLAGFFGNIEIVEDKNPQTYRALLEKHRIPASHFLMVGNSLKSDILPVLAIGGQAVFIPYEHTWAHEHADGTGYTYHEIEHLGLLPELIAKLSTTG
jgi:putative hydrolase of the HAD superfamily